MSILVVGVWGLALQTQSLIYSFLKSISKLSLIALDHYFYHYF